MNINDIITKIEIINQELNNDHYYERYASVQLELHTDDEVITGGFDCIESWRGYYAEPCLFLGKYISSKELLKELYFTKSGNKFNGWKGGVYQYSGYNELNMETDLGSYSGDGYIESVEYDESLKLIIIKCVKD